MLDNLTFHFPKANTSNSCVFGPKAKGFPAHKKSSTAAQLYNSKNTKNQSSYYFKNAAFATWKITGLVSLKLHNSTNTRIGRNHETRTHCFSSRFKMTQRCSSLKKTSIVHFSQVLLSWFGLEQVLSPPHQEHHCLYRDLPPEGSVLRETRANAMIEIDNAGSKIT